MTVYAREFDEEGNSLIAGVKDPFYEVWKTLSTGADVLLLILENTEEEYLEQDAYKLADAFYRLRDDYIEIGEITRYFSTKDETIKYIKDILEELISNNFLQRSFDLRDSSSLLINKEEESLKSNDLCKKLLDISSSNMSLMYLIVSSLVLK